MDLKPMWKRHIWIKHTGNTELVQLQSGFLDMLCVCTARLCLGGSWLSAVSFLMWKLKLSSIFFMVFLISWQGWSGQQRRWDDASSWAPISDLAARWQLPGGRSGSACFSVCPSPPDCSTSCDWSWRRAPEFRVQEIAVVGEVWECLGA